MKRLLLLLFLTISTKFGSPTLHKSLYQEIILNDPSHNIIFSPFSIQMCLALSYMGAGGTTADEIGHVLGYTSDFNTKNISHAYESLGSVLQLANKIYVTSVLTISPTYETSVKEDLKSSVESIDFEDSLTAMKTINDWIEQQINSKIREIIKADDVSASTVMVLINAVYFKSHWKQQFVKADNETFINHDATQTSLEFMKVLSGLKMTHVDSVSATVVKLPYHRSNIAMYFVIPDDVDGWRKIEQDFDWNFNEIDSEMVSTFMEFHMPRFEFDYNLSLKDILKKLGMKTAFETAADFTKIFGSGEHSEISKVLHKAFIKVDEKGTEAGAASVAIKYRKIAQSVPQVVVKIDRPFMFAIVSPDYATPIFMGTVKHL